MVTCRLKVIVIKCSLGTRVRFFLWVCDIGSELSSRSVAVMLLPWNLIWSRILTS